ncbi:hypothetical protein N8H74_16950 [Pseudomonas sp. B2M1-30]|uniref:hypothetical protein n=1 Tax=Pseudomonas TaxID=286 RepID=UPI0021C6FF89|nr:MULTISPECIES: hypothetical protein [Pseudomonas]MCU0119954.1 hypothetical protein [Pseudomonas sp. B2M1-30]MCU7261965.1 hypothetical protein [Pseudomonas koreensis]
MSSTSEDQEHKKRKRPVTCFDMWDPWRESVIEQHRFYVEQGKSKLLSQFSNMEQEANEAAERWLEKHSQHFDPERDDPGNFEEDAYHEGVEYYRMLSELKDQTRLSIVAGIYHAWDKELRGWLLKEIEHWHRGPTVSEKVWKATFDEIAELLISTELANRNAGFFQKLSACRYVVNVYKHGEGLSLKKIKSNHPEYLRIQSDNGSTPDMRWIDHTHLLVTDKQLDEFSSAIVEFWRTIPNRVSSKTLNVPTWFEKAMDSDHKLIRS